MHGKEACRQWPCSGDADFAKYLEIAFQFGVAAKYIYKRMLNFKFKGGLVQYRCGAWWVVGGGPPLHHCPRRGPASRRCCMASPACWGPPDGAQQAGVALLLPCCFYRYSSVSFYLCMYHAKCRVFGSRRILYGCAQFRLSDKYEDCVLITNVFCTYHDYQGFDINPFVTRDVSSEVIPKTWCSMLEVPPTQERHVDVLLINLCQAF